MSDRQAQQLTLWEYISPKYKLKQPVILLEMFAGIGAQHKALSTLNYPNGYGHGTRVHNDSVALTTRQQPVIKQKVGREKKSVLRIRKLVPLETMKLMGFTREDYQAMRDIGMSDSAIYHCAGDSIIVPCLVALFNPFVNDEHEHIDIINEYVERKIVNDTINQSNY